MKYRSTIYKSVFLIFISICNSNFAVAQTAASPRALVLINRSVVKLKDLFQNAGVNADAALGSAPSPGGRIVVGSRQLTAIARQYGVDWQPDGEGQSVSIERPGTPVDRAQIMKMLTSALQKTGGAEHLAINITG